uniref:ARAD1D16038p n=1 Tax=Blastobotrys adeninivorans TaxID=409370 RepID=A0A060TA25_BLAAD
MTDSGDSSEQFEVVIKSSSDQKYNITTTPGTAISELKATIAEKSDIAVERQRLIYAGRVLKDHETVGTYKIKAGQTIHLVKGAAPQGSGQQAGSGAASATSTTSTTTSPGAGSQSQTSQQVPTNIAAGQGSGNILADLTGARYAGLAQLPSASMFGPDGGMGPMPGPEDLISMMEQPGVAESMQQALQNPQMIDMMINSNPQLRQMGPQFRQMMQSEQFRNMITNPQMMRQMLQMEQMMSGLQRPNQSSGFPAPGAADDASTGANNTSTDNSTTTGTAGATGASGAGGAPANPFAALFPGAQQAASGQPNPFMDPNLIANLFGGQGGNSAAPAQEDTRPPEERYEAQLRQLNELGFYDFDRNVRALRRSGGNVQGAIEALLDGHV